jgi:hypothetical protein
LVARIIEPPPEIDGYGNTGMTLGLGCGYTDLAQLLLRAHSWMMRWICCLLALAVVLFLPVRAGDKPPQIMFRVHVQIAGEGLSAQEATSIPIPPNGEIIQVRTLAEATERDIIAAQQDAGGLHIQFNHVGTVNLNAVTAQNQGHILVVLVDGQVFYAPTIDEQISNGRLDIPHQLPPTILAALQAMVQDNVKQANRS